MTGVRSRRLALLACFAVTCLLAACASAPLFDETHLAAQQRAASQDVHAQRYTFGSKLLQRVLRKIDDARGGAPLPLDILVLSGGGEYGAFGVGFLQGWRSAGMLPQPQFDVVTGVSTGALIAPFALLGTEDSIGRVESLYRSTDRTFAALRDILFFLPWRESFYDNSVLRQRVQAEMHEPLARNISAAYADGRLLLVGTTDLDLGRMRVWDLGLESQLVLAGGSYARLTDILMASSAIPAVFPPVTIDGRLYADGGVSQQAFLGFDVEHMQEILQEARRLRPAAVMPPVRIWVIVNGPLDDVPQSISARWDSVAARSLRVSMHYSMRVTLRHLQFAAALVSSATGVPVEFRYASVPDDFRRRVADEVLFDPRFMLELNELGRRLGGESSSWRTTIGSVEQLDAQTEPAR